MLHVSPFANTGDTQGIIPIPLFDLLCLRPYLVESRHEKKFMSIRLGFANAQSSQYSCFLGSISYTADQEWARFR